MSEQDIVLHICCAPCLIYPFRKLSGAGFAIKGFFYNPNIYSAQEYALRKQTLQGYAQKIDCTVCFFEDDAQDEFTRMIADSAQRPQRCRICWYLRLKKTAEYAKRINAGVFSTTLLVSPYQDHVLLKEAGEMAALDTGVDFYYCDFRQGYQEAVGISRQEGLYRQKYCGCNLSREERRVKVL
ncbi:MAG: epoxyqueuosine reductase QueH [Candidatus Omnitrophica bacterium]|nr:epoxyqueuosine reductase QueH [Candidatus Omnitrophota bacterium]MBU4478240.1 epoxyqueuosine reductase QueH [Candidatus Omnitrophota bacterium]MCG2703308.1 epoxyqueuosine reductase QueH [Candidatus Omnitrophota bacterium]